MLASHPKTATEILTELLERGYSLSVKTRVDVTEHKVGSQYTTYGDKLWIEGPEPLIDELREAVRDHRDELLAAACILNPPVPWLAEMVKRCRNGYAMETKRPGPYKKRSGEVGFKTATVTVSINPEAIARSVASFIKLHPVHDGKRLLPIIREVCR